MSNWRLTTNNSALVVIDVQEKLMSVMPQQTEVLTSIERLLAIARLLKIPTLVTAQYPKGLGPICQQIVDATPSAQQIEKLTFSCWGTDEFADQIRKLHRSRIILCGVETHVCIQQTAVDLMDASYSPYILVDAVCSRRELDHSVGLDRMRDCGAVLTTSESAIFELVDTAGTEQFKQVLPLVR